jgi:hypothetical protein
VLQALAVEALNDLPAKQRQAAERQKPSTGPS